MLGSMATIARGTILSSSFTQLSSRTVSGIAASRFIRNASSLSTPLDTFASRHLGPRSENVKEMLSVVGANSLDELTNKIVPQAIQLGRPLKLSGDQKVRGENELLQEFRSIMSKNKILRSYLGTGYYGTITPPVILRNLLENPAWYTPYTPYQGEIAQGRLESLLNFQTMVGDLTGLPFANSSLLDEATAAAEAMSLCYAHSKQERPAFFVSSLCHPQVISLIKREPSHLTSQLMSVITTLLTSKRIQFVVLSFNIQPQRVTSLITPASSTLLMSLEPWWLQLLIFLLAL